MNELRELERRMAPLQIIAGIDAAWDAYAGNDLPLALSAEKRALIRQGFDNGYTLAMSAFRRELAQVQTAQLRSPNQMRKDDLVRAGFAPNAVEQVFPAVPDDQVWCDIRNALVGVTECATSCVAPEHRPVWLGRVSDRSPG